MGWLPNITFPQAVSASTVWAVLTGIPLGLGLGLFCRALLNQGRRGRLRLYASLWEWARQQDDGSGSAVHARRIQRYYRQLRHYTRPSTYLAWAALALSDALLTFTLSVVVGGSSPEDPSAWLLCWAAVVAAAAVVLVWIPLAALAGILGVVATIFWLVRLANAG